MSVGLQRLREEPDVIRDGAVRKGEDPGLVDTVLALDAERRRLLGESETLKAERNAASKRIGEAIRAGAAPDGPEVADLRDASTAASVPTLWRIPESDVSATTRFPARRSVSKRRWRTGPAAPLSAAAR